MFYERVLDLNPNKQLLSTINQRLKSGNIHEFTLNMLRDNLGTAFQEEDHKYFIDWRAIQEGNVSPKKVSFEEPSKKFSKKELQKRVENALRKFVRYEGLGGKVNPLGMSMQEGEIPRGRKEGCVVIEDEYNRGKKDFPFYVPWLFTV